MPLRRTLAFAAGVAIAHSARGHDLPAQISNLRIPFERYALPSNGLTVILSEDHTTPMVTVDVWYHVGSKNEETGRTGFAHLFEHVMFTGSGHVPYGVQDRLTEGVGGPPNNGTTSNDRTAYYETVPSNYLEAQFWIESDRMGWLLDGLDIAKLNAQRDIVKNERRQGVDNRPYGRSNEIITAALYPSGHPYSWPVIGSMTDLSNASAEDVKSFFRLYYAPNNATITIVGDFDPTQVKTWIAKYFTDVPRGRPIARPKVAAVALPSEKRLVYEDRVQLPRLFVVWPTVGTTHPDAAALNVLGNVLSGSRTRRLTKTLVYDRQSAAAIFAGQQSNESAGTFNLTVIPRPGHSLTELELSADSVFDRIKKEGPTAEELQKVKSGVELSSIARLESIFGKAETLANGSVFFNDPNYYRTSLQQTLAVSAADVKRVANKYLTSGRVVLSIVPVGKPDQASKPQASVKVSARSTPKIPSEAK
ncbi:MAG TPA: pitrilysin family protein [Gemmatimonadaceae bacterium]|nr:pitrilysin family protein [Gemmatimonadaceae bacterium]